MNINKFFKFSYFLLITSFLVTLFGFISVNPVLAKEQKVNNREFCFCHNQNNIPQTICVNNFSNYFEHLIHVFRGKDSFGKCGITTPTEPPSVPEFGLLPGIIAGGASAGSFFLLKKRSRK